MSVKWLSDEEDGPVTEEKWLAWSAKHRFSFARNFIEAGMNRKVIYQLTTVLSSLVQM